MHIERNEEGAIARIKMIAPINSHCHGRDGEEMANILSHYVRKGWGMIFFEPNLTPHVRTADDVRAYQGRFSELFAEMGRTQPDFRAYFLASLTDETTVAEIEELSKIRAQNGGILPCMKIYPKGVTTNAGWGVSNFEAKSLLDAFDACAYHGIPVQFHPALPGPHVDEWDRERKFVSVLDAVRRKVPKLRLTAEHVTTREIARWVIGQDPKMVGMSITPQALLWNRNNVLGGGKMRPHNFSLTVLQRREDQELLQRIAFEGRLNVFAGDDAAPHPIARKHGPECSAGVAHTSEGSISTYAEVAEDLDAVGNLDVFMSIAAAAWYRLRLPEERITLVRREWTMPERIANNTVVPFRAGEKMRFTIEG